MPSTVQTIIDLGFAKSSAARPETMTATNELLQRVFQCLREVFQVIARENPYIIGDTAQVAWDGTGWPRPSTCLRVINVKADAGTVVSPALAVGAKINVVPFDDQLFCEGSASLTEFGQKFRPTGQAMDPSGGTVLVTFIRGPIRPAAVTETIDPLFPDAFDDFLQYDIALYAATKDQRADDMNTFAANKSDILQQIIEWTHAQTYEIQQRFPLVTPPRTNTAGGRQASPPGGG